MNDSRKSPLRVAITGAAGQIGYQLSFRIASGQLFGPDQPVILQLIEIPPAMDALKGVAMELDDCAFDALDDVVLTDDPETGFRDTRYALLVGARPRTADMERKDLLMANARIFSTQGRALNAAADRDVRVLVVGNPANTNALIARTHAPDLDPRNFTAMTRLDHNRAKAQLALKSGAHVSDVRGVIIWGNHSATQYPDIAHATIAGKPAAEAGSGGLVPGGLHTHGPASRHGDHPGAGGVFRRFGRVRRHRPRAGLGAGHGRRRLGEHGGRVGRQLRNLRGRRLLLPGALPGRRPLRDCPGPGNQRIQPGTHGRLGCGIARRAREHRWTLAGLTTSAASTL